MKDYIVRFLIAGIMALFISLLFLGGTQANAQSQSGEMEWSWPTEGIISDTFGTRGGSHKGIDIAGVRGTPVLSAYDGIVTKSYRSSTYGNVILVTHPNNFVTVYAHLERRLVNEGAQVKKGDKIGTMGTTGVSTGVHLHFEMHRSEWTYKKENAINPEILMGSAEVGKQIAFPGNIVAETSAMEEYGKEKNPDNKVHIVKEGDTLWGISRIYGVEVKEIQELNTLEETIIFPGQALIIAEAASFQPNFDTVKK